MRLYRNVKVLLLILMLVLFFAVIVLLDSGDTGISGNVVYTRAEVMPISYRNCSFELYPGWNMVSFYCTGLYSPRSNILQSIDGSYGAVFEYTSNDMNGDYWKSYNPYLPSWAVQQLTHIDRLSGYWIYMSNAANFSYEGVYSDSIIYLYDGWNLIGYPNTDTKNITFILENVSFTVVKNYDKVLANVSIYSNITNTTYNYTYYTGLDVWLVHTDGSPSNNLTELEKYKGYWLNVSGNQTLSIVR